MLRIHPRIVLRSGHLCRSSCRHGHAISKGDIFSTNLLCQRLHLIPILGKITHKKVSFFPDIFPWHRLHLTLHVPNCRSVSIFPTVHLASRHLQLRICRSTCILRSIDRNCRGNVRSGNRDTFHYFDLHTLHLLRDQLSVRLDVIFDPNLLPKSIHDETSGMITIVQLIKNLPVT